ncbi:tail fiber protein [Paenibacillus sp. LHD-117]|uniref:phage tail protein n=1 Tax=Paenibacillus sp. LHD-117 TaxID=3071412 RepID=UPI0027DFFF12|nr:tail fiber protein [Paenibacillus sp. LHD-117]MDQ6422915.1 tail fiber protein [Paenibacillus sp. LHD-117]
MGEFLGEIRLYSFNFAPKGWALCNGQLLPINQNQALFSLLGTTYGGNGQTTFALPDLRGRVPVHPGRGIEQGQSGGQEAHTLTQSELPAHTHIVQASSAAATQKNPDGQVWAAPAVSAYHSWGTVDPSSVAMNPQVIASSGSSQPHTNMQPYLTLSYCIALVGIFPSRN